MEKPSVNFEDKKKYRKPSIAFLICVLAAALIWAFGYFSKDYTVKLDYKVVCTELPMQKKEFSLSDSVVTIAFKTKGVNFLNSKYSEKNRYVKFPIYLLIKNKKQNRYNYTFTKKELNQYLKSVNFYGNEFVEIESPESITVYFDKK
ncbi:MAG TPA: hypothetical protein GXZ40_05505 [Bacteroidales bacterium]|jgi:hypothetical protein|nr:hypothetical protein [Bacteroidales bacterium]